MLPSDCQNNGTLILCNSETALRLKTQDRRTMDSMTAIAEDRSNSVTARDEYHG
jgi:hypothetical protein